MEKTLEKLYKIDDKTSCLINLNQTTENFVTWVNQQKNNNDSLKDVVKTYLANTLLDGQYITSELKRMKIPTYYSKLLNIVDEVYATLDNISELKKFFLFDNDEHVKIAHDYFCEWINNSYFNHYISSTTPCRHFTGCSMVTIHRPALHADFLQNIFIFMVNNPSIFTVKDIENFINKFVESLENRPFHPKHKYSTFYIEDEHNPGTLYQHKPDTVQPLIGTYWYEMSILCEMAKYLRYYNLSCKNIKNYIKNTRYARDTADYFDKDLKNCFVKQDKITLPVPPSELPYIDYNVLRDCIDATPRKLYKLHEDKLNDILKVQDPHFTLPKGLFYRKYKISRKKKFTTLKQLKSFFGLQQNLNTEQQEQNK